jgi:DNA primase
MISKETIQEIMDAARIDEVVGEFVSLKKRGANLIGLCPFHNEKTPSFTVSPQRGIFKCFGCGKGGNAVQFLMEHEQFTYPEALRYLAKKYNIEIEEKEQTPEEIKQLNEKESLFHVTDFAAKYFADNLFNTEKGRAVGLSYFKERGFREDIIKKFQLGYALEGWDDFTAHALKMGYKLDYLEKTGLTIVKENKQYDRFRGRVIFPIRNLSGRVLGFGGRTLSADKKTPKYVNSPESDIYHKSKVLYGIDLAKNAIITNDNCFLVEGYTDVISLHMAGITNVVASSGTSLTTDQIRLISRYTKNITILYDGDEAGIKASFRGIDMILEQGMDVKIVLFPEGEDPDSFARSHRSSEVQDFIREKADNFIFFKTNLLVKDAGNDPVKKAGLIKEIVNSIALIPDQIIRSVYVKECSALLDITEQTLMNELNRVRRKNYNRKLKEKAKESPADDNVEPFVGVPEEQPGFDYLSPEGQEKDVVRLLMNFGNREIDFDYLDENKETQSETADVASFIVSDLLNDEISFINPLFKKIFDDVNNRLNEGIIPDEKYFLNHDDQEIAGLAATLLLSKYELNDWERVHIYVSKEEEKLKTAVEHALLSLKLRWLERKFEENGNALKNATDDTDIEMLLVNQTNLIKKKKIISAKLGRIILR